MPNSPPRKIKPVPHILSKPTLLAWAEEHKDAEDSLLAWHSTLSKLRFSSVPELQQSMSGVSYVNGQYLVFPILGTNYRLVTTVFFSSGPPQIYLKHFFTHKEYDKWSDNTRKSKKK
ncbi:type II toxin-antitoxin system HigB family toxin [Deinococcus kurensis]|uniref:type II toxin-antitoxin system HigB family toxin n=1 Tax=Deinococcus kurensis TaxID=2662757 RepID=UPI0012D2C62C|nr:type II toxin-antitoxin system HigB family toxin [Deinococcus kurensis]